MKRKILIALQSFSDYSEIPLKLLQDSGMDIVLNDLGHRLDRDEIIQLGRNCDGVIAGVEPYDEYVLNKLKNLKCISRAGVGIDNIDLEISKQKNITILNTPDVVVQPVAEMTIAMIFDLLRLLTLHTTLLRSGKWTKQAGHLLSGRKVGIIGLGKIGRKVAEILKVLNADVIGFDLYPDDTWANRYGVKMTSLQNILIESDVLCLHVSLSKDNPFFLGEEEISQMKKSSILINTSRGQVIDENALYDALRSGHLGGAGLDVFASEPYNGPLYELDNVVLTPHISTLTEESRNEMEKQAVENLIEFFKTA
ncbi:phosphoglycerate dehydrogenase [Candidatus Pacearchaeota archaeon]|nr:phosphoglycerate dehydrogenase [Candidatus Pacearchaeota archaeon]